MFKHLLIATDGSELSAKAVHEGARLAKALDARVTVLTVVETMPPVVVDGVIFGPADEVRLRVAEDEAARVLEAAAAEVKTAGAACETVSVLDRTPYLTIIDTAKARGCDLIVMASHGRRGVAAILLGSVTQKVLAHSPIPVLVHR